MARNATQNPIAKVSFVCLSSCRVRTGEIGGNRHPQGRRQRTTHTSTYGRDLADDKRVPMQVLKPEILSEGANDREQEGANEDLNNPQFRWPAHGFRPETEGSRQSRASPHSIQGSATEKSQLLTGRDRRHGPKNRAEYPTRSSNCVWQQHAL